MGHDRVTEDAVASFMSALTSSLAIPDQEMVAAVVKLREAGLATALLTNNWRSEGCSFLLHPRNNNLAYR